VPRLTRSGGTTRWVKGSPWSLFVYKDGQYLGARVLWRDTQRWWGPKNKEQAVEIARKKLKNFELVSLIDGLPYRPSR